MWMSNRTHLPKPLYFQKTKQHGLGSSHEERKRRLDETIPQDIEGTRNNDQCTEDGEGYQEVDRKGKYNIDRSIMN